MAQTGSRSNRKAFHILGLLNLLVLFKNANSFEFKVGGSGDWSAPSDPNSYNQWANGSRFQINDTLSFVYPADKDSVLLVNKQDYDNCNTASPIEKYSDGRSVFKLNHSGSFYFISGVHDNCVKNEKLHVVVMADRSHRNQTAASPPPSPSAADVPPSPAPSGEEAPSPPDSVEINPTPAPSQESSPPKNGASSIVMSFVSSTAAFIGSYILLGF